MEDAEQIRRRSVYVATPANAISTNEGTFIAYNRFDRPDEQEDETVDGDALPHFRRYSRARKQTSTHDTASIGGN
jgi:hypothetical protein